ncbi:oxygen-insensitive NADPH nitroreductase [Bacillus shivajii]|uniref:oxygen-insensitive NADPH nitroreductase n=1 Tax=Bacillus shivajii TaxID=1983719 RepID=UPI001CF93F41|nr:oxygen-insensitive NADPH nitroreductase [Bacillus shivajii]UCZ51905.1 oxygen-insensitive NADPH nitroreductase [Bacillus shivajii]
MNQTIETMLNHRSIRKFKNTPLSNEQIETIVKSAQMASTSSYIQAYTIIGVKNKEKKETLAKLAGNQPYVANNGHFFIFCADLYRHYLAGDLEGVKVEDSIQSTEKFIVSVVDASLAAQNATIAAESLNLGICYIGGLRNNILEVSELLKLPPYVIPLFGLAVGVPENLSDQKPRLPLENIYQEEEYIQNKEHYISQLKDYNTTVSSYYEQRTGGKRKDHWTEQMASMLSEPKRMHMKEFLEKKGLNKT